MKTALVTGSGRGLGGGFVEELANRGYTVYAGVRDLSKYPFASNPSVIPLPLDVTDDESIHQAAQTIKEQSGKLDLLVNNAGLNKNSATGGHKEKVTELTRLSRNELDIMFMVNSISPLIIIKEMISLMTGQDCFIVNVSSDRASFQDSNSVANYGYRASKVALNMFTQDLLHDLPENVRTFAVHPGSVKSNMNPNGTISPSESAGNIMAIIDSWKPSMNGAFLKNDGSNFPI